MDRRLPLALTLPVIIAAMPHEVGAALEGNEPTPRTVRLAGSHPALACGAQDFRGNPGAVASGNLRFEAGAGLTHPLGMEGLAEQAAWASWNSGPRRENALGVGLAWRGFRAEDLYRDDAGFAVAGWRWRDLGIGATASGLRSDYGEGDVGYAAGAGIGAIVGFRDVSLGAQIGDPSMLHADPKWMSEPVEGSVGIALTPREAAWRTAATAAWRERFGWSWRLAQEVALPLGVDAGLGVALEPFRIACGAGWRIGWARLDAAVEGDPVLGWQTHVSLGLAIR